MTSGDEISRVIPGLPAFRKAEKLPDTASGTELYRLHGYLGRHLLLKLFPSCPADLTERDMAENRLWLKAGIPVQRILRCGTSLDGRPYTLSRWIPGDALGLVLPGMPPEEQRALGARCGRLLKEVHTSLPARGGTGVRARLEERILILRRVTFCGAEDGDVPFPAEAAERLMLSVRAQQDGPCLRLHGDFHTGNILAGKRGRIWILDPVYSSSGAPEEDFSRILVSADCSKEFAVGQIEGYYNGMVPDSFWNALGFYALLHLAEAWSFGEGGGSSFIFRDLLRLTRMQYPDLPYGDQVPISDKPPLFWRNRNEQHR